MVLIVDQVESMLCRTCGGNKAVTATELMDLVKMTTVGEPGSNMRDQSEVLYQNFESFVYDAYIQSK